tara:strand:- start:46 stop:471 length:426 start_codon:yes stop_codon:yes gene_type:complete
MGKIKWYTILLGSLLLFGCSALFPPMPTGTNPIGSVMETVGSPPLAMKELSILSWLGGISTLVGILAVVTTRAIGLPMIGGKAIVIGIFLIILNHVIANYLSWFMIPVLIGSGAISLAWSYTTVRDVLRIGKVAKDLENGK